MMNKPIGKLILLVLKHRLTVVYSAQRFKRHQYRFDEDDWENELEKLRQIVNRDKVELKLQSMPNITHFNFDEPSDCNDIIIGSGM